MAQGLAIFRLGKNGSELDYELIAANIENATMARCRLAQEMGGNGPSVIWLYPDVPLPQLIEGEFNGVLAIGTIAAENLVDLKAAMETGLTYLNVTPVSTPVARSEFVDATLSSAQCGLTARSSTEHLIFWGACLGRQKDQSKL